MDAPTAPNWASWSPTRYPVPRCAHGHRHATWGYTRIQGALKNLDHCVGRSTIARALKAHGVPPSRQRPTAWRTFVRAHWSALRIADIVHDLPRIDHLLRGAYERAAQADSWFAQGRGRTRESASGYAAIGDEGDCVLKSVHCARRAGSTRASGVSRSLATAGVFVLRTPSASPTATDADRCMRSMTERCRAHGWRRGKSISGGHARVRGTLPSRAHAPSARVPGGVRPLNG